MQGTLDKVEWIACGNYQDITYHKANGMGKITICRPEVRNAFRPLTVQEMSHALNDAREDQEIGVIILTGSGKEAFCSGGDQRVRQEAGYQDEQRCSKTQRSRFSKTDSNLSQACNRYGCRFCHWWWTCTSYSMRSYYCGSNAIFGQVGPKNGIF